MKFHQFPQNAQSTYFQHLRRLRKSVEDPLANRGFESRRPDQRVVTAFNRLTWIWKIVGASRITKSGISGSRSRLSVILLACILLIAATASAQQVSPSPAATPQPEETTTQSPGQKTPAASPVPAVSPSPEPQQAPQLLPETNALPSQPSAVPALRDLIPGGIMPVIPGLLPSPNSAEQLEKDKIRFREIRTIAVRNPYAIYLLRKAQSEQTDELKREYLRVYYLTMSDEMRKLEPRLKGMIDVFEILHVWRSSPTGQRPTIPGRDIPRYKAIELAR
jgi:hypothetical protein